MLEIMGVEGHLEAVRNRSDEAIMHPKAMVQAVPFKVLHGPALGTVGQREQVKLTQDRFAPGLGLFAARPHTSSYQGGPSPLSLILAAQSQEDVLGVRLRGRCIEHTALSCARAASPSLSLTLDQREWRRAHIMWQGLILADITR